MLRERLLSALIGLPLLLAAVLLGGWPLAAAMALLAGVAGWEGGRLAGALGVRFAPWLPALPPALAVLLWQLRPRVGLYVLAFSLLLLLARAEWQVVAERRPAREALVEYVALVAALLYPSLFASAVALRRLEHGALWLTLVFAGTWLNDAAAFFVGRLWGRRLLAPGLSPGKSVEGAVAGGVTALVVWMAATPWTGLALPGAVALGMAAALLGPVGDLFESLVKRAAEWKDSGSLIPGHGGVLDRFDSFLLIAPTSLVLIRLFTGAG
ncbi:MAG: phosphatidate cytidylyltransferase [Clostridia bacterium]|nr:phosphatidate cytidylyltransferase [Clostridia bacterium]MCL6520982.1 phosphatidate cytidylyltransferase [Bacillota bacterium]